MSSLANIARSVLLNVPEVTRMGSLRRSTSLFSQSQVAGALYLIEEGLVKLTRNSPGDGRIILSIFGAGHVIGEEVLESPTSTYYADAEVLTPAVIYRIPREVLMRTLSDNFEFTQALVGAVVDQKRTLAEKIEMLCLHDVEYRILHYLAELSGLLKPPADGEGYQLPITQLELADLVGATRETTSTTLNQLERRGLVKLSRRLLTIHSPGTLRDVALARLGAEGLAQAMHETN